MECISEENLRRHTPGTVSGREFCGGGGRQWIHSEWHLSEGCQHEVGASGQSMDTVVKVIHPIRLKQHCGDVAPLLINVQLSPSSTLFLAASVRKGKKNGLKTPVTSSSHWTSFKRSVLRRWVGQLKTKGDPFLLQTKPLPGVQRASLRLSIQPMTEGQFHESASSQDPPPPPPPILCVD